ncbi:hypothetical protein FHS83_003777 [Rhizomicrobium palustre]|uniref:Uncharacterized protein n=1 Tax=Rhizomicrobium palustre TaxID=189966 RepID=A0A846N4L0_9PROT|nr:hypothetical protein [Rhizomicrobium palustre]
MLRNTLPNIAGPRSVSLREPFGAVGLEGAFRVVSKWGATDARHHLPVDLPQRCFEKSRQAERDAARTTSHH